MIEKSKYRHRLFSTEILTLRAAFYDFETPETKFQESDFLKITNRLKIKNTGSICVTINLAGRCGVFS